MSEQDVVFDRKHYQIINSAREQFLRSCITELPFRRELSTALDVGCGAGYFSRILHEQGFSVTGLDLRRENIEVCQERYPDIKFGLIDLDENFGEIGTYDLVLMFGILYHLQSPLQTIIRMSKAVGRVGVISTRVASGNEMAMYLYSENQGAANNVARSIAVPTFPAIVSMFNQAGFKFIYLPSVQPKHPEWNSVYGNGRRYSFVVSREEIAVPTWRLVNAPTFLTKWAPMKPHETLMHLVRRVVSRARNL